MGSRHGTDWQITANDWRNRVADQAGGGNGIHPSVWLFASGASTGHAPLAAVRGSQWALSPLARVLICCSSCPFIVTVPDRLPQPQISQMMTLSTSRSPHLHPLQDPVYPALFADQASDSPTHTISRQL
ncbi:hypothetical protein AAWM_03293 [Aspergillus awamori]|uniref:Uncharacterized protein n=1 Tax=Aspergillus awamori TaxID=105351 RepID=A0A401KMC8_ASPAW|nr:hypothetical protein AAWM_03293 [Aspergillus awamori]